MDLEVLKLRALTIQRIRDFLIKKNFLEVETPVLSSTLIPECQLEVFKTDYIDQWSGISRALFLSPNQDFFMHRLIAQYRTNIFQISKCFRNLEPMTKVHNPEFSMLQFYIMGFNYLEGAKLTEELLKSLVPLFKQTNAICQKITPPFNYISVDAAFEKFAGFKLSDTYDKNELAYHAKAIGLSESIEKPFDNMNWNELFEYIYEQRIVPNLENAQPTVIYNFPAQFPSLAKDIPVEQGKKIAWKARWQLYCAGIKIADGRTEETSPDKIRLYFENQSKLKARTAKINHPIDIGYWKIYKDFPVSAGVSIGLDRLIALISGNKSISEVLPFTV